MLNNASFEDTPADATMPSGWWLIEPGTTPDILPGFWGVYNDASDGETFIGLITREDRSFESIGQRLPQTLKQSTCYQFTIDLAQSEEYAGYNNPIELKIYIGSKKKHRDQLIFDSEPINNLDWEMHRIEFIPDKDMRYIIIEASSPQQTTGNILIDNITPIVKCNRV